MVCHSTLTIFAVNWIDNVRFCLLRIKNVSFQLKYRKDKRSTYRDRILNVNFRRTDEWKKSCWISEIVLPSNIITNQMQKFSMQHHKWTKYKVLGYLNCYKCFQFSAWFLFCFQTCFSTQRYYVYIIWNLKLNLTSVRAFRQGGGVSVLRLPVCKVGKLISILFCSSWHKQQQSTKGAELSHIQNF